jgi:predicted transcriptional regulator
MSKKTTSNLSSLGSKPPLGPLESQIMEIIWNKGEVTIRDIYDVLRKQRDLAYTTIMTVVHNLYRKGLLSQHKDGNAHFYTANQSRSQFIRSRSVSTWFYSILRLRGGHSERNVVQVRM